MQGKNGLDLLLINPGGRSLTYQKLEENYAAVEPPIWAGLLGSFVRNKGYSVAILDSNAEQLGPEDTAKMVEEMNPLLVAVVVYGHNPSASTQVMPGASAVCTQIRNILPEQKILMLGGHVAALPERTLLEENIDFVCDGEGLYTLIDLIEAMRFTPSPDFKKVRGLLYLDGKNVIKTPSAPLVTDLDNEIPDTAWDILPIERYRAHNWHCYDGLQRQPYVALYTSLGCPFRCKFCCIQAPFRSGEKAMGMKESIHSYRLWSPKIILDQIGWLVEHYNVKNIKFADEMFVLNTDHVSDICDGIVERGYDVNIWAYARVDTVRSSLLEKLKVAGVNWLAFGIESGADQVRDDVSKGIGKKEIFDAMDRVRQTGIHIGANFIFGLPEDSLSTMQETLNMALEINPEFANFYCAMAYPGSKLYEYALSQNWQLPAGWHGYSQYSKDLAPLPTKYLTARDVLRFRDNAFQVFHDNPNYLALIENKFGRQTVQHIREMTSVKLERTILGTA